MIVDAPAPFKALLEKNLDIEHAAHLADAEGLDDNEWARLVAAAPAQARALAQTEGYFNAVVTVEPEAADPDRLHIKLVPGEPATVGRLTLDFDGELARKAEDGDAQAMKLQAQVRDQWKLKPGAVFRNGAWSDAKSQALSTLRAEGYAAAVWTATASQVDPQTNKVRLFLIVDSGPRFLAGDLVVEGLERQPERNVRLLAGFGPGTPLTQKRLLDYQDRLQKTGLFDQIAVIYDPDPNQADHATVTVHLHEQSLQQAQVSGGYSSLTGPRITLEHIDRKPFDLPATLSNKLQWGRDLQEWDGSIATHPAESFHSWIVGASVSRIISTGDQVRAGMIRFGRTQDSNALDRMTYVEFERSIQCNKPDQTLFPNIVDYCVDARALSLNQANVWRNVDSVILPTQGYTLSGQVGVGNAGGPDSAYGPYTRLYGRLTEYWPLPDSFYFQGRIELGQIIVNPNGGDARRRTVARRRRGLGARLLVALSRAREPVRRDRRRQLADHDQRRDRAPVHGLAAVRLVGDLHRRGPRRAALRRPEDGARLRRRRALAQPGRAAEGGRVARTGSAPLAARPEHRHRVLSPP